MEYSLRQAKYSNPDAEIILLGDEANNRFDFIKHFDIEDYSGSANEFVEVYEHYSTNPFGYELFCFQRWFILENFMKNKGYEKAFVCDTDVMLYSDINTVFHDNYKDIDFGLMIMENNMSIGISYLTASILEKLILFLQKQYTQNKAQLKEYWNNICRNKQLGGYSDMIAVTGFVKQLPPGMKVINLLASVNNAVFDRDINNPLTANDETYEFKSGKKRFSWIDKEPYCLNKNIQEQVKFHLVHFQGPAKYLIASFYRGAGFKNKVLLDLKFAFLNLLAFLYAKYKIRYRFSFIFNYINKLKK
jgi:hypothetical protein